MPKYINQAPSKKVPKNSRHVRWNWEKSPDAEETVRYHFIIVDDKNRKGKMEKILENIRDKSFVNYPFEEIRSEEGKVEGTEYRYIFKTYDTQYAPNLVDFKGVSENIKRDKELSERKKTDISWYVENKYSKAS